MDARVKALYAKFVKNNFFDKALEVLKASYPEDKEGTYDLVRRYRHGLRLWAKVEPQKAMEYMRESYLLTAQDYFDDFCIMHEWKRPPEERFYLPRRKMLYPIVEQLQRLEDGKIDILSVSCPPGIGKSGLATFFQLWLAGRHPDEGTLSCSHNASFLRGLYEEILRELDPDGDYAWSEVFPSSKVVRTNAMDLKIDIDKAQRFSTFQMASIGAQNAGRVRATGMLYVDDIVSGIEEALSEERLQAKWTAFSTDMLQRMQCRKILMIATRWSVRDPIGRLKMQYQDNDRAVFLTMPALNEKDESNFDYGGKIGFSTRFYHDIRKLMDPASWKALYMNEPVERSGLLYPTDELQRFMDLPLDEPDAVWAVCDTKNKGTDYFAMPIVHQYGDKFFVVAWICDNHGPEVVEPRLVDALVKYKVKLARFESNAAGGRIAQNVQEKVKESGGITKITTKYTTANKETRIIVDSAFIKENFLFRDPSQYDSDYRVAMNFLCSYSMSSKNRYDDVPDAMSQMASLVQGQATQAAVIMKRFW